MKRSLPLLLLLLAALPLLAAAPPRLFLGLTPGPAPADWTAAPPLTTLAWQPDLFAGGAATVAEAVAKLRQAVLAAPGREPLWVRLDAFDLYRVGDCATCAPPPPDPDRLLAPLGSEPLSAQQLRFAATAATALAGTRARPYLVVPADTDPLEQRFPDHLLVLLDQPTTGPALTLARRTQMRRQLASWRTSAAQTYAVVRDGYGAFHGLPLSGDLLAELSAGCPSPAVEARDAETYTSRGPAWLAAALRAAALEGRTSGEGHPFRTDQPEIARIVDVFAPVEAHLASVDAPSYRLAEETLRLLRQVVAWDAARVQGRSEPERQVLLVLWDQRQSLASELRAPVEPSGPFSTAFRKLVAADEPLPAVALPRVKPDADRDARAAAGLKLVLDRTDTGAPSLRPATVWLAVQGTELVIDLVASEPRPADVTRHDRLLLTLAGTTRALPAVRLVAQTDGQVSAESVTLEGSAPVRLPTPDAKPEVVYDAPGWRLTWRVPLAWATARVGAVRWRLQLAVEHRRGRERYTTVWQPTVGAPWNRQRFGACTVAAR